MLLYQCEIVLQNQDILLQSSVSIILSMVKLTLFFIRLCCVYQRRYFQQSGFIGVHLCMIVDIYKLFKMFNLYIYLAYKTSYSDTTEVHICNSKHMNVLMRKYIDNIYSLNKMKSELKNWENRRFRNWVSLSSANFWGYHNVF